MRESLPWSLIPFAGALLVFLTLAPAESPNATLMQRLALAELPAFGIMAAALVLILSYRLSRRLEVDPIVVTAAAAICFVLSLPQPQTWHEPLPYLHRVGECGLFLAIIVSLIVAYACRSARSISGSARAVDVLTACALILCAFMFLREHLSLGNAVIAAILPLGRLGDTYAALLLIVVVETLLWIIGVHGPAALAAIVTPIYLTLQMQNTQAFAHHHALPHIVVVSLFLFVFPGGAGATLPLAVLLALSKVQRLRRIGRVTIIPALFNINEPLLFGLPIVLNPFLAVPFIAVPIVLATISYAAVANGMVARAAMYVPSAVPSLASTYLATFDPRAVLLVAVNLIVATLLYTPFVRAYERHEARLSA